MEYKLTALPQASERSMKNSLGIRPSALLDLDDGFGILTPLPPAMVLQSQTMPPETKKDVL